MQEDESKLEGGSFFQRIDNVLRNHQLRPSLICIHTLLCEMLRKDTCVLHLSNTTHTYEWELVYTAQQILMHASDILGIRPISEDDIRRIHCLYNESVVRVSQEEHINPRGPDIIPLFVVPSAYEQRFWQEPIRNLFPRQVLIYALYCADPKIQEIGAIIAKDFHSACGIELRDYLISGLYLSFYFYKYVALDGAKLYNAVPKTHRTRIGEECLYKTIESASLSYHDFRKLPEPMAIYGLRRFSLNHLFKTPIIRMNNGEYWCPAPRLAFEKFSNGTYFALLNHNLERGTEGAFFTSFGHLFEAYVGQLLACQRDCLTELYNSETYPWSTYDGKRCDWIVIDVDSIILIECKASRMPRHTIESMDLECIQTFFIERYLSDGIAQLVDSGCHLKTKYANMTVYRLMVINDIFPYYNRLIDILPAGNKYAEQIEQYGIQFATVNEFELLIANISHCPFREVLNRKTSEDWARENLDDCLRKLPGFETALQPEILSDIFYDLTGVTPSEFHTHGQ